MWCDYHEKGAPECPVPYDIISFEDDNNYFVFCRDHRLQAFHDIQKEIEEYGAVVAYEDRELYKELTAHAA